MLQDKTWQFATKEKDKRLRSRDIIFSAGRQVAAYTAEDIRTILGSKATWYFLMHLSYPDIVFTLVIGERYDGIGHKSQNTLLIKLQSLQ